MQYEGGGVMREPRNTQNTRKNDEVVIGDFNAEAQRRLSERHLNDSGEKELGAKSEVICHP